MLTVGMDVHERTTSMCILDRNGRIVKELTIKGHPRKAVQWLRQKMDGPFQACFEASTNYGWLFDQLKGVAAKISVAHPGRLRLIFKSRRKNDRLDAGRLAKLMYLDEVPVVHVPCLDVREWRGLIEHRNGLVQSRASVKGSLRALLRTHGIEARRSLWTKVGVAWLEELELPEGALLRRDQLVDDLRRCSTRILRVEAALARIARRHPGITLLMTIPGVGIRTAEAFLAYVDDPRRFKSRSIGAYLGLIPRQDASAGVNRLGRITREGPSTVRKMLAEASWQAIRRSDTVQSQFERYRAGRGDRRKKALVATAHYLARVMLSMLKTGEVWREHSPTQLRAA